LRQNAAPGSSIFFQPRVNVACQLVALDRFFADGEGNPTRGRLLPNVARKVASPSTRTCTSAGFRIHVLRSVRSSSTKRRPGVFGKGAASARDPRLPRSREKTFHVLTQRPYFPRYHPFGPSPLAPMRAAHVARLSFCPAEGLRGGSFMVITSRAGTISTADTCSCLPRQLPGDHIRRPTSKTPTPSFPHGQPHCLSIDHRCVRVVLRPCSQRAM